MKSSIESTEEWPLDWPDSACQFAADANIRIAELIAERNALKIELAGKEAVIKALQEDIRFYRKDWKDQMMQDQS